MRIQYEIDSQQKGQWVIWKLAQTEYHFFTSKNYVLNELDVNVFERSLEVLIDWHESLRSTIGQCNGKLVHNVWPASDIDITKVVKYFNKLQQHNDDNQARQIANLNSVVFDLEEPPLFRVVIDEAESKTQVTLIVAHIFCDPESFTIILRDMQAIYLALSRGEIPPVPSHRKQLRDFYFWKNKMISDEFGAKSKDYLQSLIAGVVIKKQHLLPKQIYDKSLFQSLSTDADVLRLLENSLPIATIFATKTSEISYYLPEKTVQRFHSTARFLHLTPFNFIASVISLLIYLINNSKDQVIAFATSNRKHKNFEDVIGWLVSCAFINTRVNERLSFKEYTKNLQSNILEAIKYSLYPLDLLTSTQPDVPILAIPKLFLNVLYSAGGDTSPASSCFEHRSFRNVNIFAITCTVTVSESNIEYICEYKEPYTDVQMTLFSQTFLRLLEGILGNPDGKVSDILLQSGYQSP